MNHIELFSGCGGLSLGLEKAGFTLKLANELSPMASETFAYNLLNENLKELGESDRKAERTFWISSRHDSLTKRLRENPLHYPELNEGISDIPSNINELKGNLVVGNIIHLNQLLAKNKKFSNALKTGFASTGVDLVSGGPPCQSFSLAGLRKKDCDKNSLPWEFAQFVDHVRPKIVLLENVTGILRPFKEDGISYHAWFEVSKAFAEKGYVPLCLHINARLAGVAQNRPRFIMIGVRKNVFNEISKNFDELETELFSYGLNLLKNCKKGVDTNITDFRYFDAQKPLDLHYFEESFLHNLVNKDQVSVEDALGDIKFKHPDPVSNYIEQLNETFSEIIPTDQPLSNHEPRNNNELVKRRFRIYQILNECDKPIRKEVTDVLKGKTTVLTDLAWSQLKGFKFLQEDGKLKKIKTAFDLVIFFQSHSTKKQTQKALIRELPAPAALSIPDDGCHYDENELRTLTVREMARIQSFPDGYEFRSKVTTGGKMRRFEVPQYTQVGNAVPPLLGLALGETIKELLDKTND
ncbi:DNA cytosine methyltransferase [Marinicellulosiphila megalodicopiae]|uniref:DNA cytosine methyltransferase n=1 Tax=Marinicellulosiphila megalodicopiae TaxID=2724896 RepID=UPI003BB02274